MKTFLLFLLICLPVRGAVVFDGGDDVIGFGTAGDTIFNENSPITFSCWFTAVDDGEASAGTFIRRGINLFRVTAVNALRFTTGAGGITRASATASWTTNFYNHVVMTWDGSTNSTNVHFYVNTAETSYVTSTDGALTADNSADPVVIGNNAATTTTFRGTIAEVAVWGSVLTIAEIQSLFRSRIHYFPLQVSPSTLLAYWPLDDFSDGISLSGTDTIFDRSSKNRLGGGTNGPVGRASSIVSYP